MQTAGGMQADARSVPTFRKLWQPDMCYVVASQLELVAGMLHLPMWF